MEWILLASLSAIFAGLTSILAKMGIKDIDSTVVTALRTIGGTGNDALRSGNALGGYCPGSQVLYDRRSPDHVAHDARHNV